MRLKLTHSKRPFQEVTMSFEKFEDRYLWGMYRPKRSDIIRNLNDMGKAELSDCDGTLFIEVIK